MRKESIFLQILYSRSKVFVENLNHRFVCYKYLSLNKVYIHLWGAIYLKLFVVIFSCHLHLQTNQSKLFFSLESIIIISFFKQNSVLLKPTNDDLTKSCIGFHSFLPVCEYFHYLPCCVNLSIKEGVEPFQITNYSLIKI